jgi:sulfate transport system permease protein
MQGERATTALSLGLTTTYLSLIVALPIAALVFESTNDGARGFWEVVSSPEAVAALKLTLWTSIAVALINAVLGTITAWVLVRDSFRGRRS